MPRLTALVEARDARLRIWLRRESSLSFVAGDEAVRLVVIA
jgi:hypothetical protein